MSGSQGRDVVRGLKEIQAGHGNETNARIEMWIGLTGDNVDLVSRIHQCFTQVFDVDSLTTAIGLAAISKEAYLQRFSLLISCIG
jgi:hypothetical protein